MAMLLHGKVEHGKIFLYTKGTEGSPRQELRDMLKYIEKSTTENITNQDIESVSKLVNKIKKRKEVGVNYMKSWEIEQMARDEGYAEGHEDGLEEGIKEGLALGTDTMQEKMNRLIIRLTEVGRTEDIIKAAKDKEYQNTLFEEFGL